MTRRTTSLVLGLLAVATAACRQPEPPAPPRASATPGTPRDDTLEILELHAVQLADVGRSGQRPGTDDRGRGLLVRVRTPQHVGTAFLPRAMAAPTFVLGSGRCDTIVPPWFGGDEAVLLCPPLPEREPAVLWLDFLHSGSPEFERKARERGTPVDPGIVRGPARRFPTSGRLHETVQTESQARHPAPPPPPPRPLEVLDLAAARLERPVVFHRDGTAFASHDGLLVRLRLEERGFVFPESYAPHVVYGRSVCITVIGPMQLHEAAFLCPVPGDDEPAVLWLTRADVAPRRVRPRKDAEPGVPGVLLDPRSARTPPLVYPDVSTMARDLWQRNQEARGALPSP